MFCVLLLLAANHNLSNTAKMVATKKVAKKPVAAKAKAEVRYEPLLGTLAPGAVLRAAVVVSGQTQLSHAAFHLLR